MLTKSNMAIQMNLFKFEGRKSGFIRQAKQQRSSGFFVNNLLQSVRYGIWQPSLTISQVLETEIRLPGY